MIKRGLFFVVGLFLLFVIACGDEKNNQNDDDTASDSATGIGDSGVGTDDSDSETNGDSGVADMADSGDSGSPAEVDALTACTDFQVTSWNRIRDCGSITAAILPPNDFADDVCASMCETEGKTVSKSAYDTCMTYAATIDCADIDIDLDAGSQIPEACSFLRDLLACQF